jgi:16S rRNA (cytidine1402-2'-O)-methyltransferase
MPDPGTLYVVATPLGNLGDLTLRAREVLREVNVVAAEDTRRIRGLLSHLDAHPKVLSFHAHSSARRLQSLQEILADGRSVALVTDAGTPGISDPGADLVAQVRNAGFPIVPLPGPSAVATALSGSGLPADRYLFLGFIPRKGKERARLLQQALSSEWTVVLYEAPPRLTELLRDLANPEAERHVVVARELTKLHEEFRAGTLAEVLAHYEEEPPRGEVTVVLEGRSGASQPTLRPDAASHAARLLGEGLSRKATVQRLMKEAMIPRNEAYRIVMEVP